jgi:beta-glucanase (GH16 family)
MTRTGWLVIGLGAVLGVSACGSGMSEDALDNGASGGAAADGSDGASAGSTNSSSGGSETPGSGGADGVAGESGTGGYGSGGEPTVDGWSLVWFDEFDDASIDPDKWQHEVDCWGGGNNEDQCYVSDAKNSFVAAGMLHIVAIKDSPSGPEGGESGNEGIVSKGHSSARLRTMNRGDFKYGRIEARLQLPSGQGLWPAFWMLPTDATYGGWAASGEIDIMEAVNLDPSNEVHGTLHYGGAWPDNTSSGTSTTPSSPAWDNFHVYAVEWEEGEVRWFVDDTHYQTQNDWFSSAGAYPAPFDERFHIVLNVAVGGAWPGPPDGSTTFPQELVVDYVRVFECTADTETGHGCGKSDPNIEPL